MNFIHKELASGKWRELTLMEQLGNVGSEVERTMIWKKKNRLDLSQKAFDRCLELMDLTIQDPKNKFRLKEICRCREALVDYFMYDNIYGSSDELWHRYFFAFAYAARMQQHNKQKGSC
ncbi:MAG: hypothetical protein KAH01_03755 [Caldisericia bacterium]|nr:hypothetical protein [Caldisericia bacterium]